MKNIHAVLNFLGDFLVEVVLEGLGILFEIIVGAILEFLSAL